MKKYILSGILSGLVFSALSITIETLASGNESANGQGKLVNADGSQSRFSFSARRNGNGKVTGQATLQNPSFKTGNGEIEQIKIDITCLKVVGKVAIFGGVTKRKNNQEKTEATYFAVEDNGDGAGADKIFRGFYFDDDPSTEGDAQLCQTVEPSVIVLEPIAEGKIEVGK